MLESLSACFTGPAPVEESVATPRNRRDWPTSAQLTELSRLKRENSELRRTNEILRLARSFSPRRPTRPGGGRSVRACPLRPVRGGAVVPGAGDAAMILVSN